MSSRWSSSPVGKIKGFLFYFYEILFWLADSKFSTRPSKWFINDFPSSVQLYISAVTLFWYFVLPFKKVPSGISTARPQFRDESEIQMTLNTSYRSVNFRSKFSGSHFLHKTIFLSLLFLSSSQIILWSKVPNWPKGQIISE